MQHITSRISRTDRADSAGNSYHSRTTTNTAPLLGAQCQVSLTTLNLESVVIINDDDWRRHNIQINSVDQLLRMNFLEQVQQKNNLLLKKDRLVLGMPDAIHCLLKTENLSISANVFQQQFIFIVWLMLKLSRV